MNSIKVRSLWSEGSKIFKRNFLKLATIHLIIFTISLAIFALLFLFISLSFNGANMYDYLPIGGIIIIVLFTLALLLLIPILSTGYKYIYIKLSRNEKIFFKDIFAGFSHFWSIWLTQYFTIILTFGGIFLLIIPILIIFFLTTGIDIINTPSWIINSTYINNHYSETFIIFMLIIFIAIIFAAIYWSIKFMFTNLVAIDKKLHPGGAIYYGSQITNSYKKTIFLTFFVPILIMNILYIFFRDNSVYNIILSIFNLFVYTPWLYSVIGTLYTKLSINFDNNPPGNLNLFTGIINKEDTEKKEEKIKGKDTRSNNENNNSGDKVNIENEVNNNFDSDINTDKNEAN